MFLFFIFCFCFFFSSFVSAFDHMPNGTDISVYYCSGICVCGLSMMVNMMCIFESIGIVSQQYKTVFTWRGDAGAKEALTILRAVMQTGFSNTNLTRTYTSSSSSTNQLMLPPLPMMRTSNAQIFFHHNSHIEESFDDDTSSIQAFNAGSDFSSSTASVIIDSSSIFPFSSSTNQMFSSTPPCDRTSLSQRIRQLSQAFVQMFLSTPTRIVTMVDARNWLRCGETEATYIRDIANVLTSLNWIECIYLSQVSEQ